MLRKIISKIVVIVLSACIVCGAAVIALTYYVTSVTDLYEQQLSVYSANRKDISQVSQDMYCIESLLWIHILNDEATVYGNTEADLSAARARIEDGIARLNEGLTDSEELELLHQVLKSYSNFANHIDVVLDLSYDNAISSTQYYINQKIAPYLTTARNTLTKISEKIESQCLDAEATMDSSIRMVDLIKTVCLTVASLMILLCISLVVINSRRILSQQEKEQQLHQQRVMDLQYRTIVCMANLIENRDGETGEHVKRTGAFVQMITKALRSGSAYSGVIDDKFEENMWKAAPMHDVGKIKIPDAILNKPGRLTPDEFAIMKTHASEGGDIIEGTIGEIEERDYLDIAHDVARYHHERWDGTGYPDGLKGEEIPLCARIMAVADVFDALVSERCYKKPMSIDKAYEIITEESGTHFDPEIVRIFLQIRPEIEKMVSSKL